MKNFRVLTWSLMMAAALFMTSCFDILEEYEFNADGSGKAKMTIDLSELMAMMATLSDLDSTGEAKQSMDDTFSDNSTTDILKQINGIKNVRSLNDRTSSIIGYSYEFDNIEALNNALAATSKSSSLAGLGLGIEDEMTTSESANYFEQKGKKFLRVIDNAPKEKEGEEEGAEYEEMAKQMFKDAKYEVRYSFASPVKKIKGNKLATLGPDGKTVNINLPMSDLMDQKASAACEVRLK